MVIDHSRLKIISASIKYFSNHHVRGYDRKSERMCRAFAQSALDKITKKDSELSKVELDAVVSALYSYVDMMENNALWFDQKSLLQANELIDELCNEVHRAMIPADADEENTYFSVFYE